MLRILPCVTFLSLAAISMPAARAQLVVSSVSPSRNASAPTATAISVTFATPVTPATVTSATLRVFGRWSGVTRGTIGFTNADKTVTFAPSRPFFPGEVVTVGLSSQVSGAAGALVGGHAFAFTTRPAAGSRSFTRVATIPVRRTAEGRVRLYGAYAGDLDGDGAPDLSMPCEDAGDVRVMRNDGCGVFAGMVVNPLVPTGRCSTNEGQDFDGDGVIDLAVGNINANSLSILRGDGSGGYLPAVHYPSGSGTRGLAVLDVDGDGDIDVVTANRAGSTLALHKNNGNGTFAAATFFDGGGNGETGVGAADANGDGIMDLFVANYTSQTVTLLLGNGAGGFTVTGTSALNATPWMIATGDVDGDGKVDAVTCNSSNARMSVVRGDGLGGLLPAVHYPVGTFPLAIDLGDLDGDGDLDAVVSSFSAIEFNVLFNDGTGVFGSPIRLASQSAGSCALIVDFDRDGDMDILGIDELDDLVHVFQQDGPSPQGVQPPSCDAALRVGNLANRGGYGTALPHDAPMGGALFLGVSSVPNAACSIAVGLRIEPGIPTSLGILNLAIAPLVLLPVQTTNAFGESLQTLAVPTGLPPGASVALQGIVVDAAVPNGALLTNPERVVLR